MTVAVRFAVLTVVMVLAGCDSKEAGSGTAPQRGPAPITSRASTSQASTSQASTSRSLPAAAGLVLIERVRWTVTAKGRQLQVFPTQAGRTDAASDADARAWAEILAAAPDANTPGMHDQFLCHWNFARTVEPDKPSWNLEPWRPVVGYEATVAALCNPGGAEG